MLEAEVVPSRRNAGVAVAKAAAGVMAVTLISKVLGFGREAALAAVFGASALTDAYLVAAVIPTMLFGIVNAAITTVGIPVLSEYLHRPEKRAQLSSLVWSSFHAVLLILALFCLIALPAAPWLVRVLAPGFGPEQAHLTAALVRIMLPAAVFMGLAGWAQGVLNAHRHFLVPAAVGIPYNLVLIGAIFLSGAFWGITGLAWATVLAVAAQFVIQLPVLRRQGLAYAPVLEAAHPGLKKMGWLVLPVLVGVGAGQLNLVVDRMLASGLPEGSISALNYALKVIQIPQGLLAASLITVLYPSFAQKAVVHDLPGFRLSLARGLAALAAAVVPVAVGAIVLRREVVALLFQRGAFDINDAAMTAVALLFYALGLLFLAWRDCLARAFYALQDTATPMTTGLAAVGINIGLNLLLVRPLAHGGLALATSVAALANCGFMLVRLRRRLGGIGGRYFLVETAKVAAASLVMGLAVWALNRTFQPLFPPVAAGSGSLAAFALLGLRVGLLALAGGMVYLAACRALLVHEVGNLAVLVRARLLRPRRGSALHRRGRQ